MKITRDLYCNTCKKIINEVELYNKVKNEEDTFQVHCPDCNGFLFFLGDWRPYMNGLKF